MELKGGSRPVCAFGRRLFTWLAWPKRAQQTRRHPQWLRAGTFSGSARGACCGRRAPRRVEHVRHCRAVHAGVGKHLDRASAERR